LFGLEGGEFFLHPQYEEILALFKGKDYDLLTNGILFRKVIKAVEKFGVKQLSISMDGTKETYKRIRGVDTYDNILEIVKALKEKTRVKIAFTFTRWNTKEDYLHVKKFCEEHVTLPPKTGQFTS
jgi:MoaA/NifB/PqqE/SkfB family radical SAM enzyme